MVMLIGQNPVR